MNQDQKIKKLLELFNRRYGIALFSILWNNHSHGAAQNLDEIYSRWQILRPSRTTFSILIREFEHAKVIKIVSGNKKSEKIVHLDEDFLRLSNIRSNISLPDFLDYLAEHISLPSS